MPGIDSNVKLLVQSNGYSAQSKAIACDTAGDGLSVADSTDWDFGTGEFCIETWVLWKGSVPSRCKFYDNSNSAGGTGITCFFDSGNNWTLFINAGAGELIRTFTPVANKWYHVVFQRYSGNLQLYINGQKQGADVADSQDVSGSAQSLKIIENTGGLNTATGSIKNYRVSNVARYTANFIPPTSLFSADSNTKLLLLGEETNGATTFTDSSTSAKTVTTVGGTKLLYHSDYRSSIFIDTESTTAKLITDLADSKIISKLFNNTAGFFDGTSYVRVEDSPDWDFGTGDFTIEGWFMWTSVPSNAFLFSRGTSAQNELNLQFASNAFYFYIQGVTVFSAYAFTPALNNWYHIAISRSGTSVKLFVNGLQVGATATNSTSASSSSQIAIGSGHYDLNFNGTFFGWIKEIRYSNSARYTATFTPSTTQFTSDTNTKLLLHFDSVATAPLSPSIKYNGSNGYLSVPNSTDFNFTTGDFTAETWLRFNSVGECGLISNADGSTGGFSFNYDGTNLVFRLAASEVTRAQSFIANRWYHVAACRSSGVLRFFVDGQQVGSDISYTTSIPNSTGVMRTGTGYRNSGGSWLTQIYFNGWMKSSRVSNSARYTTAFTPSQTTFVADSNTKLLLLGAESNGSTSFIDSEASPRTVTTNGTVVTTYEEDYRNTIFLDSSTSTQKFPYSVSTTRAKVDFVTPFGTGVAFFDGSGDYLTVPDSADWNFGTGQFTMEMYVRFPSIPGNQSLVSQGTISTDYWNFRLQTGNLYFYSFVSNSNQVPLTSSATFLANCWYHIALVRTGTDWRVYQNGISVGNVTATHTLPNHTGKLAIGTTYADIDYGSSFSGLMDNIRISDTARYTATFLSLIHI